ncbi:MAG: hypothetical protein PHF84_10675 [bacterium]|nr:hypothetical protein [bacterium]
MNKFLVILCIGLVCLLGFGSRADCAQLNADEIETLMDEATELRDDGLMAQATNKLIIILKQEPKHPEANKLWVDFTGHAYVPPVSVQAKEVYTKSVMAETLKKNVTTAMGEARVDIAGIVDNSTRTIVADAVRDLSTDAEFRKQLEKIMGEAFQIEKTTVISVLRESLELPKADGGTAAVGTQNEPVNVDPKVKAKAYYDSAIKLLDEQRYDDAKKLLQEASQLDPANEDIKKALDKMGP